MAPRHKHEQFNEGHIKIKQQLDAILHMTAKDKLKAWKIWQEATERLKQIVEKNVNISADDQKHSSTNDERLFDIRKSKRLKLKSDAKIHTATTNKNQITLNVEVEPIQEYIKKDIPKPVADTKHTRPSDSDIQAKYADSNSNPSSEIAEAIVQQFIAHICHDPKPDPSEDESCHEPTVTENIEAGSEDTSQILEVKVPLPTQHETIAKIEVNVETASKRRGRKSALSDEDMKKLGFCRKDGGGYRCFTCDKAFPTPNKAELHVRIHSGNRPHSCSKCNKSFIDAHSLKRHEMLHLDQPPYPCPYPDCSKGYVEQRLLEKHITNKHHDSDKESTAEKPTSFKCEECGKEMKYKANLAVHKKLCHEGKRDERCPECGKQFQTRSNLIRHQATHSDKRPYSCAKCLLAFKTLDTLQKHTLLHDDIKPHRCEICEKGFISNYKLHEHMETHEDRRAYLCEQCGRGFNHRNTLRTHYRLHFQQRTHQCPLCQWAFYTKGDLKRHQLRHSEERRFKCQVCRKTFARRDAFHVHLNIHTDAAIYRCFYCGKSFWDKNRGKRHVMWCTGSIESVTDLNETCVQFSDMEESAVNKETNVEGDISAPDQAVELPAQTQVNTMQVMTCRAGATEHSPMTSTVLNLSGVNLEMLSINSGYVIVRRPWSGQDEGQDLDENQADLNNVESIIGKQVYMKSSDGEEGESIPDHNAPRPTELCEISQESSNTQVILMSPLEQAIQQAGLSQELPFDVAQLGTESQSSSNIQENIQSIDNFTRDQLQLHSEPETAVEQIEEQDTNAHVTWLQWSVG